MLNFCTYFRSNPTCNWSLAGTLLPYFLFHSLGVCKKNFQVEHQRVDWARDKHFWQLRWTSFSLQANTSILEVDTSVLKMNALQMRVQTSATDTQLATGSFQTDLMSRWMQFTRTCTHLRMLAASRSSRILKRYMRIVFSYGRHAGCLKTPVKLTKWNSNPHTRSTSMTGRADIEKVSWDKGVF